MISLQDFELSEEDVRYLTAQVETMAQSRWVTMYHMAPLWRSWRLFPARWEHTWSNWVLSVPRSDARPLYVRCSIWFRCSYTQLMPNSLSCSHTFCCRCLLDVFRERFKLRRCDPNLAPFHFCPRCDARINLAPVQNIALQQVIDCDPDEQEAVSARSACVVGDDDIWGELFWWL